MCDNHQIFISYASPDQDRVIPFYEFLEMQSLNPWIDCRRILPGQNWDFEIKRALDKSSIVVIFLSHNSVNRRGYFQRELKIALDKSTEKLVDDIYLIPVLLDDYLQIPDQLRSLQFIHANAPKCNELIVSAIRHQLDRMGIDIQKTQQQEHVYWSSQQKREVWDGLPGYEVEFEFIEFRSDRYPNIAEIGEYVKGDLIQSIFRHREEKLIQSPDIYDYGQDTFLRTNTCDAFYRRPVIKGNVLSIQYTINWYGAGAAHPNFFFKTFSFVLEPLFLISSLEKVFAEPDSTFVILQADVREQLYRILIGDDSTGGAQPLDKDRIDSGTENWRDFSAFVFGEQGLEILFAPYHIAGYVCGPQLADIPYDRLAKLMRPEYQSALQVEHLLF